LFACCLVTKYKVADLWHTCSSHSYAYIKTAEQERVSEDQHRQANSASGCLDPPGSSPSNGQSAVTCTLLGIHQVHLASDIRPLSGPQPDQ
jgi:hypothetical protein